MKGVARLEREMGEVKERLDRGEAEINRSEGVVSASGIQLGEGGQMRLHTIHERHYTNSDRTTADQGMTAPWTSRILLRLRDGCHCTLSSDMINK